MNRLKPIFLDFSVGTLNFLANTGVMLPYILILTQYQKTQSATYLAALVAFYISRAASIFYTKRLNLRSSTYLVLTLILGALGSLPFAFTQSFWWLIGGSLLWGYSGATIWPYFLTVKLHLTATTTFHMKRLYWLVFLLLIVLLGVDSLIHLSFSLTFATLAILNLLALPGGRQLDRATQKFYAEQPTHVHGFHQLWRWWLSVLFFAVLGLLTMLRKTTRMTIPAGTTLALIGLALIIAILELYADRNLLRDFKYRLLNRGFLLSFVLLFSSFMATFYWGKLGMYLVFMVYIIGFEGGASLLAALSHHDADRAQQLSQQILVASQLLILIPWKWTYILALLGITLYIGYDNPTINNDLYQAESVDSDTAIINKYRFSTSGGLLCQLALFALLTLITLGFQHPLMAFFKPTSTANWWLYTWALHWPLTVISLIFTAANLRRQPNR